VGAEAGATEGEGSVGCAVGAAAAAVDEAAAAIVDVEGGTGVDEEAAAVARARRLPNVRGGGSLTVRTGTGMDGWLNVDLGEDDDVAEVEEAGIDVVACRVSFSCLLPALPPRLVALPGEVGTGGL